MRKTIIIVDDTVGPEEERILKEKLLNTEDSLLVINNRVIKSITTIELDDIQINK